MLKPTTTHRAWQQAHQGISIGLPLVNSGPLLMDGTHVTPTSSSSAMPGAFVQASRHCIMPASSANPLLIANASPSLLKHPQCLGILNKVWEITQLARRGKLMHYLEHCAGMMCHCSQLRWLTAWPQGPATHPTCCCTQRTWLPAVPRWLHDCLSWGLQRLPPG